VKRPRFRAEEVATALEFLVKYGFAKSSDARGTRFRVVGGSPAPRDVAKNAEELNECLESFSRERFHNFLLSQGTGSAHYVTPRWDRRGPRKQAEETVP